MQRIDAGIQRRVLHFAQRFHAAIARFTYDGACRLGALLKRGQANLIGIGKTGFLTAHGANANALIDVIGAIFNDAVF
ncbi:hypothetical protein D3C86_1326790 [compost metagenome]